MLTDLRTYDPDRGVNDLSRCFDYAADLATHDAVETLLADAKAKAERLGTSIPARGEGLGTVMRLAVEHNLAEMNVLLLEGALRQAEAAVGSYPRSIIAKANEQFGLDA